VIQSQRLATPIAFGVLRPTIGLPPNFEEVFDARKQRVILVHELAHLVAHDPIWYLLADLATTVFWWHPGVWWMRRHLQLASEWAADEASLLVEQGPGALAECLVQLGAVLSRRPPLDQLGIEGFRSNLGCRVQRLIR
jgi:beta-lactamase regulating signal transducer with metallopeptidase domain